MKRETLQDSHRPMILLNHNLDALLHLGQHGVKILSDFGFAHAHTRHTLYNHAAANCRLWLSRKWITRLRSG